MPGCGSPKCMNRARTREYQFCCGSVCAKSFPGTILLLTIVSIHSKHGHYINVLFMYIALCMPAFICSL